MSVSADPRRALGALGERLAAEHLTRAGYLVVARNYRTRYGVDVPRSRIAVTTGSSGALLLTMGAILSPGERVLMTDPGYPCNRHFVRAMEGDPLGVPVDASTAYQLTANLVEKHWTPKTAAVLVASPSTSLPSLGIMSAISGGHW